MKIIHRIYACDSLVSKFDDSVSETCAFCSEYNDIVHWFVICKELRPLWDHFQKWCQKNLQMHVAIDIPTILFGDLRKDSFIVNYCILHMKDYIHKVHVASQGNKVAHFAFINYISRLKYALVIEKQIAVNRSKISTFDHKFELLIEII